jgi:hypothetical protein
MNLLMNHQGNRCASASLGNDTLTNYRAKTATFEREIAEWHDVTISTDHDDVAK